MTHCPLCHHATIEHGPNGCEAKDALEEDGLCACRIFPELLGNRAPNVAGHIRLLNAGLVVVGIATVVNVVGLVRVSLWFAIPFVASCATLASFLSERLRLKQPR